MASRSQPPTRIERLGSMPSMVKPRGGISDKEAFETELIQSLMVSYFNIVRKNVIDTVPKSIMHFLVNQSKQNAQNELVSKLYKEDLLDELLEESPTVASRRKACTAIVDTLRRANKILNDVRDFSI
jgi:replication fork clamp-binding protein CrfC